MLVMEDDCLKKTKEIRIIVILRIVIGKGEDNSSIDVKCHIKSDFNPHTYGKI